MEYDRLIRPFEPSQIRLRDGKKGMRYKYVSSHDVINRLNEVNSFEWSFSIRESKLLENEVVVLGSLNIKTTVKEAYGSAVLTDKNSAGDCFKAASALALTKAASLFGVPCIFHSSEISISRQNQYSQFDNEEIHNVVHISRLCEDCSGEITPAEINFSTRNVGTYKGKKLCRMCQVAYRGRA